MNDNAAIEKNWSSERSSGNWDKGESKQDWRDRLSAGDGGSGKSWQVRPKTGRDWRMEGARGGGRVLIQVVQVLRLDISSGLLGSSLQSFLVYYGRNYEMRLSLG
jgi:hypothetical protein